jgi:4-hydroxy-4-methyl-2-oxoglutarate aldolase
MKSVMTVAPEVDFGESVEVGSLQIKPGNSLHGDQHGVVCIPIETAERLPNVAAEVLEAEKELIELCKSERFSFEELKEKMQRVSRKTGIPDKESN